MTISVTVNPIPKFEDWNLGVGLSITIIPIIKASEGEEGKRRERRGIFSCGGDEAGNVEPGSCNHDNSAAAEADRILRALSGSESR